jgi:hypothetical protein
MLDSIRTLSDVPAGALLVRRADRLAERQRQRLLEQARRHASALIAEAREQADQIRLHAMREGHNNGILQAAGQITQALLLEQGMASRLRSDVVMSLRNALDTVLGSEPWLEQLLQRWLEDVGGQAPRVLQVLLPQGRAQALAVRQYVQTRWPHETSVEWHAEPRFVFRLGDHVLEFDPAAVSEPLAPRLAAQMKALRPAMGAMDQACADYLQTWVDGVVAGSQAPYKELSDAD